MFCVALRDETDFTWRTKPRVASHCEEGRSPDEAIYDWIAASPSAPRNDVRIRKSVASNIRMANFIKVKLFIFKLSMN
jgi:hypothetical protein